MTQDLADVRAGVIAELSASDLVGPIEKLRAATVDVLEHVQAIDPVGEPDNRIAEMRVKVEPYLALVLPLADHGGERGLEAVLAAVAMFATEEGESSDRPNAEPLLAMALHDLVWTLAAYALTYDRTDIPVSLAEVTIPSRYAGEEVGVFVQPPCDTTNSMIGTPSRSLNRFGVGWLVRSYAVLSLTGSAKPISMQQSRRLSCGQHLSLPTRKRTLFGRLSLALTFELREACARAF